MTNQDKNAARKVIFDKAANHHFRPGSMHQQRYVDPLDYERWEQQRLARKKKRHTLDPYR